MTTATILDSNCDQYFIVCLYCLQIYNFTILWNNPSDLRHICGGVESLLGGMDLTFVLGSVGIAARVSKTSSSASCSFYMRVQFALCASTWQRRSAKRQHVSACSR